MILSIFADDFLTEPSSSGRVDSYRVALSLRVHHRVLLALLKQHGTLPVFVFDGPGNGRESWAAVVASTLPEYVVGGTKTVLDGDVPAQIIGHVGTDDPNRLSLLARLHEAARPIPALVHLMKGRWRVDTHGDFTTATAVDDDEVR